MKSNNHTLDKSMVSVNTENLSLADTLKLRMMKIKSDMPKTYISVYEDHYGTQTNEMKLRIRDCVNLRVPDEEITSNWELIVKKRKEREAMLKSTARLARSINETSAKNKSRK